MDNNYIQVANNEMNTVTEAPASNNWRDNIGEGLTVTVVGVGVVFFVLCVMIVFINLVKKLDALFEAKMAGGKAETSAASAAEEAKSPSISTNGDIDDETMAVIIASVAAVVNNSRIRSVSLIPTAVRSGGAWVSQVRTQLHSHRIK